MSCEKLHAKEYLLGLGRSPPSCEVAISGEENERAERNIKSFVLTGRMQ